MASTRPTAKTKRAPALDPHRPFDPKFLRHARRIAEKYRITIHFEDGEYYGRCLELPGVANDGKTPAECIEKTLDIITSTVAYLLEENRIPRAAAIASTR